MARMLGAALAAFCPLCRGKPGLDCPDRSAPSRKAARAREKRAWKSEQKTTMPIPVSPPRNKEHPGLGG